MVLSIEIKREYTMRSKVIFLVLFMLSFSAFHDSFFSILDKNTHTDVAHYINDNVASSECVEFNEVHNMLHFMAIMDDNNHEQIEFAKRETIPHISMQYSPPLEKTSYKPPIA